MLVVKVEIWPGGDEETAKEIGRMGIANVSNLREMSNYVAVLKDDTGKEDLRVVERHPRSAGFEELLLRVLQSGSMTEESLMDVSEFSDEKKARLRRDLSDVIELLGPVKS